MKNINFVKLCKNAVSPRLAHDSDAGYDMTATSCERIGLFKWRYGTGIAMEIPNDYEGEARPRSSIFKTGMILSNSPGTIDSGYRGEIMAVFWKIPFIGKRYQIGDRIFQLLIKRVYHPKFYEVNELEKSDRGNNGFGSTGK